MSKNQLKNCCRNIKIPICYDLMVKISDIRKKVGVTLPSLPLKKGSILTSTQKLLLDEIFVLIVALKGILPELLLSIVSNVNIKYPVTSSSIVTSKISFTDTFGSSFNLGSFITNHTGVSLKTSVDNQTRLFRDFINGISTFNAAQNYLIYKVVSDQNLSSAFANIDNGELYTSSIAINDPKGTVTVESSIEVYIVSFSILPHQQLQ